MKSSEKILLYDGECPFCVAYTTAFVKWGVMQDHELRQFSTLDNDPFLARVDENRQGNEIPLVDAAGGQTVYGVEALLVLLGRKWPLIPRLFGRGLLNRFVQSLYRVISHNRRILLPRHYSQLKHSCAPTYSIKQRVKLISFCSIIAMLITALFGAKVGVAFGISQQQGALVSLIACGAGWILQQALAIVLLRKDAWDYIAHLSVLQLIGVVVLLPSIAILPLFPVAGLCIAAMCVALSSTLMFRGHRKRIDVLAYSQRWTISWAVFLALSATTTVLLFIQKLS